MKTTRSEILFLQNRYLYGSEDVGITISHVCEQVDFKIFH
jgi:hypothetical protein